MLGVAMDSLLDTAQLLERPTLEEVTVPQRSITDFFQSPTKPVAVSKPSTLLGYFTGKDGSPSVSSQNSAGNEIDGKPQSKKRKRNSVEDLNSSLNDFDSSVRSKSSETTRKKVKSSDSAKRKSQKVVGVRKAVSHPIGTSDTCGSPYGKENEVRLCAGNYAETVVGEVTAVSEPRNKLSVSRRKQATGQAKGQRGHSSGLSCDSRLSQATDPSPAESADETTTIIDIHTPKVKHQEKCEQKSELDRVQAESKQLDKVSKTEQTLLKGGRDGNLTVEVSYEDFLRSEGIQFSERSPSDNDHFDEEQPPQLTVPKCHKVLDYFKKTTNQDSRTTRMRTLSAPNGEDHIVTKADVHFEPSPPHASTTPVNKHTCDSYDLQTSNILLSHEECDMDIFEISSEIIEVSPFKPADKVSDREKSTVCGTSTVFLDSGEVKPGKPGVFTVDKTRKPELTQSLVQKTTQATLCFTKKGLGMNKLVNVVQESSVTVIQSEKECTESMSVTRTHKKVITNTRNPNQDSQQPKRGKKSAESSATVERGEDRQTADVLTVPSRRSPRTKHLPELAQPESRKAEKRRKKTLRGRYRVAQLQPGCDNRSPIRIRLKRCSRSSGDEESIAVTARMEKTSVKTKAQKLVEKAKKKQKLSLEKTRKADLIVTSKYPKGKQSPGKSKKTSSTRFLCKNTRKAKTANVTPSKNTRKPKAASESPVETPKKAKTKKAVKLAPIFTKKQPVFTEVTPKTALDPEIVRQRQEFLKSSLPENLKRRNVATVPVSCLQHPPIPRCSHVQQAPAGQDREGVNVWDLPTVDIKLRDKHAGVPDLNDSDKMCCLTRSSVKWQPLCIPKDFCQHEDLHEKVVDVLLKEIQRNNPNFPVQRLYKCYQTRKEEYANKGLLTKVTSTEVGCQQPSTNTPVASQDKVSPQKEDERNGKHKGRACRRLMTIDGMVSAPVTSRQRSNRLRRNRKSKDQSEDPPVEPPVPAEVRGGEHVCVPVASSLHHQASQSLTSQQQKDTGREQLWTEKYQPSQSLEMIGNSANLKRLKSWLQQWKHRTDKEARRLEKLLRKQRKTLAKAMEPESSNDWWTDDDSDFADTKTDRDWLEAEEDALCNTMLISGPIGIGKTSAVYALAQELGYQVFEVNSTSSRAGKKILGKLQEATQSHQVAKQSTDKALVGSSTPGKTPHTGSHITASPLKAAKMPAAFTNLFRKTKPKPADVQEVITIDGSDKKKPSKAVESKRKRFRVTEEKGLQSPKKMAVGRTLNFPSVAAGDSSSSSSSMATKALNLSSTSLILFDEVDVVFEEDKGFWAAIQSFMNTTKRPIILTTSDSRFSHKFEGRFDHLVFKKPPYLNTVTCLQLLCLVENVRTEFSDILNLVEFYRGDLRRCVQALQYWVESGGGIVQEAQPVLSSVSAGGQLLLEDELSQCPDGQVGTDTPVKGRDGTRGQSQSGDDSRLEDSSDRCALVAIGGVVSRLRVVQDDSSVDSFQSTPRKKPLQTVPEVDLMDENAMFPSYDDLSSLPDDLPPVHRLCVESLVGASAYSHRDITDLFTGELGYCATSVGRLLQEADIDLRFSNLELLLPLSVSLVDSGCWPVRSRASEDCTIFQSDLAPDPSASDSSDSEWIFDKQKTREERTAPEQPPVWEDLRSKLITDMSEEQRNCLGSSVESLSNFYEFGSFTDVFRTQTAFSPSTCRHSDLPDWGRASVHSGLTDEPRVGDGRDTSAVSLSSEMAAELRVRSLKQCYDALDTVNQTCQSLGESESLEEQLSVPVLKGYHQLRLSEDLPVRSLAMSSRRKAMENLVSCLPLHIWSQTRSVSLDYTPVLRSICAAEQVRHVSKIKRRFLHYLDGISLPIKEFTMNVLGTSLR
ncbi:ATPase family AAA domain-containing protein 5-like isoform X2 [Liolophura sinensis]|uniref:ATPase family AAA domain-containing protein 5-like isoform X2 n=1 Tax=Liolophura sinensis TaxID=3198878 RepID=UPI0031589A3F